MPDRRGPAHVGAWIDVATARHGIVRSMKRAEAVVAWPDVAGRDLATFSVARSLRDGVLYVDVADAETAMHLSMQRTRFVEAFAARLGARTVKDVRFVTGDPHRREGAARTDDARQRVTVDTPVDGADLPFDDPTWSRLAATVAASGAPPALRDAVAGAARAFASRRRVAAARGEGVCPTCDAWTPDGGPCHACRRYRANAAVLRRVDQLIAGTLGPSSLTAEEEHVALTVAVERCVDAVVRWLPSAMLDRRHARELATWAARRQALVATLKVENRDDDLDDKIAAVLRATGMEPPIERDSDSQEVP